MIQYGADLFHVNSFPVAAVQHTVARGINASGTESAGNGKGTQHREENPEVYSAFRCV